MASAGHALGERPDLMKGGGMRSPDGDRRPRRGHGKGPRRGHGKVSPHAFLPSPGVRATSLGSTAGLAGQPSRAAGRGGAMRQHQRRRRLAVRAAAITGCATLLSGIAAVGAAAPGSASAGQPPARASAAARSEAGSSCRLGNGVKHVIELTFDNVHFFRDNPNVPSDLEMMPSLLHFLTGNGTLAANNHTPLIAHTADDLLTTFTGLYGDRAGMPVSNSYQAYNTDGTTDPAGSFAYWTDPIYDTASSPTAGHDTNPSLVYSPAPPATTT